MKTPKEGRNKPWDFGIGVQPGSNDFAEGRLVRIAGGIARRPFVVESYNNKVVRMVNYFSEGYGDITPDKTNVTGIVAGRDELVVERWAWMQPVFRSVTAGSGVLVDPFRSLA